MHLTTDETLFIAGSFCAIFAALLLLEVLFIKYKSKKIKKDKVEFEKYRQEEIDKIDERNFQLSIQEHDFEIKRKKFEGDLQTKIDIALKSDKEIAVDTLYELRKLSASLNTQITEYANEKNKFLDNWTKLNELMKQTVTKEDISQMVNQIDLPQVITKEDVSQIIEDALEDFYVPSQISYGDIESAMDDSLNSYFDGDFDSIKSDIQNKLDSLEYSIKSRIGE